MPERASQSRRVAHSRGHTRNANPSGRKHLASGCESATLKSHPIRVEKITCVAAVPQQTPLHMRAHVRTRMCKGAEKDSRDSQTRKGTRKLLENEPRAVKEDRP